MTGYLGQLARIVKFARSLSRPLVPTRGVRPIRAGAAGRRQTGRRGAIANQYRRFSGVIPDGDNRRKSGGQLVQKSRLWESPAPSARLNPVGWRAAIPEQRQGLGIFSSECTPYLARPLSRRGWE